MKPNMFNKIVNKLKSTKRCCKDLLDETQSWYKGELSREKAENYLFDKEIGVFVIRKSETINNAWVLSIRVPRYLNYTTIAHYLIEKSKYGYQLKNCTNYYPSLIALVTHCSIVRDNLPVMLNLDHYKPNEKKNDYVEVFNEFLYYSSGSSIDSLATSENSC